MSLRRTLALAVAVVVLAAVAVATLGWRDYQRFLVTALPVTAAGENIVIVQPGMSYGRVVALLEARQWVHRRWHWWLLGRLDPSARRLQAGEYQVGAQVTPPLLLDAMAKGLVVQHQFTIIEGWQLAELRRALAANAVLVPETAALSDQELATRISPPLDHPEGWFLPETYHFTRGTSDLELLQRAHDAMRSALNLAWEQRQPELPVETPYEVLVLASIVEKETAVAAERPQVAGVFVRRLNKRMRLQTDPTVIYGLGASFDGNLRRRDLRTDTPYNTYTRHGLPPTPIALPGRDALLATVNPAAGDALYFVARGDGSHQFSATLDEHNRAVDRFQRGL